VREGITALEPVLPEKAESGNPVREVVRDGPAVLEKGVRGRSAALGLLTAVGDLLVLATLVVRWGNSSGLWASVLNRRGRERCGEDIPCL
jgi:hypothetical protein